MKNSLVFRLLFLAAALVGGAALVRAEDLAAVKARMNQRLAAVDALKDRHAVGENNRGYLEARSALKADEERTVSDENADRRVVYQAIAAQSGASPEVVGRQRAQQLAQISKSGVWLQGGDGVWYQKP
jgi:uncharacterized protein YdbL (DUF1318 family)